MYKIPLTNSPNQTFKTTVPVDGKNVTFTIKLSYNEVAKYWQMSVYDSKTETQLLSQLPLLFSFSSMANMARQFSYKELGSIYICAVQETDESMPNDLNIGQNYILIWGDNE